MIYISNTKPKDIKSVIFDFDGTLSLVRQGWQDIMIPYFTQVLTNTPKAGSYEDENKCVREFVDILTGKQTIFQCIALNDEVVKRGGKSVDPLVYKKEYNKRLLERIEHRRQGLYKGEIKPNQLTVPGTEKLLEALTKKNIDLYLASGTDEEYVLEEAGLIDVAKFFKGKIYGARDDYKLFSKAMVIKRILELNNLKGFSLAGFGDGYVEIENVKEVGGTAIGVASNEADVTAGMDLWKKKRLTDAGADVIIADYMELDKIMAYLFGE